ncbi:MAG: efflux RND transporter permease subunit [Bacteroidetes bacterium]|nr:efflux RND transporter permease subunit [Bacteroidota bacterium]
MWNFIARLILSNRLPILIIIGLLTAFMAYEGSKCEISYSFNNLLPEDDSTAIVFQNFKKTYGANDNVIIVATDDKNLFQLDKFQSLYHFNQKLNTESAVDSVFSATNFYVLRMDSSRTKFVFKQAVSKLPASQHEVDSIKTLLYNQKFYDGLLWKSGSNISVTAVSLNPDSLDTPRRNKFILNVFHKMEEFAKANNIKFRYSGLPYVRGMIGAQLEKEINVFLLLSALITAGILFFFVRSLKAVLLSMLIVGIAVVFSFGTIALFGYKLTLLSSLIPALIVVLGIPNCIFMLEKYFEEYKSHGDKMKGIHNVISKIGTAIFMINFTTAIGFATFALTKCAILVEFGIIAALNIMVLYVLCIVIVPIAYSYMADPTEKDFRRHEKKWLKGLINKVNFLVAAKRRWLIYAFTIVICALSAYGISLIETKGRIVDEIPEDNPIKVDLHFFEDNFSGIVPFEIIISKKKGQIIKEKTLEKTLDKFTQLYALFSQYPEFSKPVSIVDAIKYAKQAYYNGNPDEYALPTDDFERAFILSTPSASNDKKGTMLNRFVDKERKTVRISIPMKDVVSLRVAEIKKDILPKIKKIFEEKNYTVDVTGPSIMYARATELLFENLFSSILFAIAVIAAFIAYSFRSFKMVMIALIPNIIPLLITAGVMGYFGIPLKISTLLTFSIAFGITVDNTIHFLDRYKHELEMNHMNINIAVTKTLNITGISIFYTSLVLFFGFFIFTSSDFGGTVALGFLISLTLLTGMLCNIIILPATLLTLEKSNISKVEKQRLKAEKQQE